MPRPTSHPGRRLRPAALIVLAAVLALLITGCSSSRGERGSAATAARTATPAAGAPSATAQAFPFTLTGTDGRSLKLTHPPQRIVSLSPGTTETLFAIGAGDTLVAVDRFSDFPEQAKALPKVEYTNPSVEALAGFRPDLIIASVRQKDAIPAIEAAGLPVTLLEEPGSIQGVIDRVRLLGRVTSHSDGAEKVAADMERRITAVKDRLAGVTQGPRVFHELSADLFTAAPNSFVGDLYALLKAQNIAAGATTPFPQLSQEAVVGRDPEVIVLADAREGVTPDQVRARPGWSGISAVRNGRVYPLTSEQADIVSRPGPRVVDGLELLAKLLYPDRFA